VSHFRRSLAQYLISIPVVGKCRVARKISINGKEYILCSGEEFNQPLFYVQHTITRNLFAVINGLFKEAGSDERIFSLYGGNDHVSIFLTHELFNLLAESDFAESVKDLRLYEE